MKGRDPRRPDSRRARRAAPAAALTRSPERHLLWLLVGLVAATALAYQPAWHGGILWDDDAHLTRRGFTDGAGLWRIWSDLGSTPQYYPVTHTAFWLMNYAWGIDPLGYHLVSIGLHALSAVLLVAILRRLAVPGAILAAVVFALHPVHAESVAWISEIKNTLSGFFYMSAALMYLRYDAHRRPRQYAFAALLFACALLSKTVTASLPAALLIVFWWQRGTLRWREDVLPLVPFFAMAAAAGGLTAWLEHTQVGARGEGFELTLMERCLVAGRALWFYAAKLVWPAQLTFTYPRWSISEQVWWQYLFPMAAIGVAVAFWGLRTRTRAPLAALLFFVVTLFPALGFINVFPFKYSFVADHFQYLASLGIIVLLCGAIAQAVTRRGRPAMLTAGTWMIGAVLGGLTWQQSHQYVDAATLYRTTLERNPSSWMAHNNLGALLVHGSDAEAERAAHHLQEAIRLNPEEPEAHTNLGLVWDRLGRRGEALQAHREALRLDPGFAEAHYNLGNTLVELTRHEEAVAAYKESLRINPYSAETRHNLSTTLAAMGRLAEALPYAREALEIRPDSAEIRQNMGNLLLRTGRAEEAIHEYREALRLKPGSGETYNNLGLALRKAGRLPEALAAFEASARLAPDSALVHANMAEVLRALGRNEEAAAHMRAAALLDPRYRP